MDATIRRFRLSQAADSAEFAAFWRDHGREWAEKEAAPDSRARIRDLVERSANGSRKERQAKIVAELKQIWSAGFPDAQTAYAWDEMGDDLPASALVAFVDGVCSVAK